MKSKFRLVLSFILLGFILVGCKSLEYTPTPSPMPVDFIPTVIALTGKASEQALATPSPVEMVASATPSPSSAPLPNTATSGPSPTALAFEPSDTPATRATASPTVNTSPTSTASRRATFTPTITPTPTIPVAAVQISEPGPMSKVASPLELIANFRSTPSGSYHVEIWLEPLQANGEARLLFREVKRILGNPAPWFYLDPDIPFELSRVSELGQLRISVLDQFDRLAWVNSVNLILLSIGESDITPSGLLTEPIVIREPYPNQLIQGGTVIVSGEIMPSETSQTIELVAYDGTIVGYANTFATPAEDGSHVPFAVEVPYQVTSPTWVRLQVSENGIRIPGIEHLSSIEIYLSP